MRKLISKMWNDDAGIVAFEYLLVATIVGLALVVGLAAVSAALNSELTELANAILALNQSYTVAGQSNCHAMIGGTSVTDIQGFIGYGSTGTSAISINSGPITVIPCN